MVQTREKGKSILRFHRNRWYIILAALENKQEITLFETPFPAFVGSPIRRSLKFC
ncbi:hypothetical protein PY093_14385 [Cytobacillus sp. S13-E01]|uniref:hypothetical protein n=1 Tax=Cytobacillus sp. S13-E01 TaxID=3031326 RepID=UPI0023D7CBEA|nr:hypothetical protein [Cytobacillus sp. S13-E01]MDF0727862.1 hypothetical protein [Cytobacillus sp. S13-E01]